MQSNNIFMNNKRITAPTTTPTNNPSTASTTHRRTAAAAQACAACKYQRRKCAADCILAPYFPHDRQRQFLNAHRLFGVSNIVKIVRLLNPPEKDAAMRTIIIQSEARAADPVGGCHRIIRDLQQQIELTTAELEIVLHHLALCRAAAGRQQEAVAPPQQDVGDAKWKESDVVAIDYGNAWNCMDGMNVHAHAESSLNFDHDHDQDLKSILDNLSRDEDNDDGGYKFDCHGILPSNNDILIKEEDGQFSYIQDENELKSAAADFTLTNCDETENIENKF